MPRLHSVRAVNVGDPKVNKIELTLHMPCGCPSALRPALFSILLLCGFAHANDPDFRYVVRAGDNPWNLTQRYLKSVDYWPRIQSYNNIDAPTRIPPGTVLHIPVAWMRSEAVSASVIDLRGVVISEHKGEQTNLAPGAVIKPGSVIRTRADSSFTLAFPDGSTTLVGANAEVRLRRAAKVRAGGAQHVELELLDGELENRVESRNKAGGRFLIHTPSAVAAVRGTDFRAVANANATRIETLSGEVALGNKRGQVKLAAGSGSRVERDQRPETVTRLLPAPDLSTLPARIERLPFDYPLPPVEGAQAYRSQIAPAGGFSVILSDRSSVAAAAVGGGALPDGRYRIRVRAIDGRGIESGDAEAEIELDARPEPPFPTTPKPGDVASDNQLRFEWAGVPESTGYHFELAADREFSTRIVSKDALNESSLNLDLELAAGEYFWRVAVSTAQEGRGPFSDPQHFRRLQAGPPAEASTDAGRLTLRWRNNPTASSYRIQISSSSDFAAPEHEFETSEPLLSIDTPPPGIHFIRVRHVEADGAVGPWGPAQTVEVAQSLWPALLFTLPLLFLL